VIKNFLSFGSAIDAAKNVYGTTLANVDYLHGTAEFLLTLTNLFLVLGLRQGIRKAQAEKEAGGKELSQQEAMPTSKK